MKICGRIKNGGWLLVWDLWQWFLGSTPRRPIYPLPLPTDIRLLERSRREPERQRHRRRRPFVCTRSDVPIRRHRRCVPRSPIAFSTIIGVRSKRHGGADESTIFRNFKKSSPYRRRTLVAWANGWAHTSRLGPDGASGVSASSQFCRRRIGGRPTPQSNESHSDERFRVTRHPLRPVARRSVRRDRRPCPGIGVVCDEMMRWGSTTRTVRRDERSLVFHMPADGPHRYVTSCFWGFFRYTI